MQLTPLASNMTEVETSEARILFSYRTPVAAYIFGKNGFGGGFVRTEKWWSVTTSRHINKWLPENGTCLLYTSPSPRDYAASRMPSSA